MKVILLIVSLVVMLAGVVYAFPAWVAPGVLQSDTTLGENMKIQKNIAVLDEIKARVEDMARFSGYSSHGQVAE